MPTGFVPSQSRAQILLPAQRKTLCRSESASGVREGAPHEPRSGVLVAMFVGVLRALKGIKRGAESHSVETRSSVLSKTSVKCFRRSSRILDFTWCRSEFGHKVDEERLTPHMVLISPTCDCDVRGWHVSNSLLNVYHSYATGLTDCVCSRKLHSGKRRETAATLGGVKRLGTLRPSCGRQTR